MRFKAELAPEQLQLLLTLIGPISRLSQHCVVFLDEEYVRLSTRDAMEGISCFCELNAANGGIFLQHRIESIHSNEIVFEIDLIQWKTAIQSVVTGRNSAGNNSSEISRRNSTSPYSMNNNGSRTTSSLATIMKLAKRHGIPCLCLEGVTGSIEVYHAIPIRVMRATDMQQYLPPQINMPDVQLEISNEKPLRTVVERLKSIAPHVYIQGSMDGKLILRVDADASSIQTYFSKLIPKFEDTKQQQQSEDQSASEGGGGGEQSNNNIATCTLKVDTRKLLLSLLWQQQYQSSGSSNSMSSSSTTSSALLCMVENEMLVLHVLLQPASVGFFTYYVPVHYLSSSIETSQL